MKNRQRLDEHMEAVLGAALFNGGDTPDDGFGGGIGIEYPRLILCATSFPAFSRGR